MKRSGIQRLAVAALLVGFGLAFVYCKLRLVAGLPRTALAGEAPAPSPPGPPPADAPSRPD